ncbi:hypothetical protein BXU11_01630 [Flavobacterium sp. LM5]|uniref:ABC-three component system middle component 4 n=1 Tax=Flavobacterium sp. LM5 TaxID=1938610 RepID=UPI0009923CF9|nr:ABC-three component system middle component 4 [Flavobacterium sp. LM5]OOV28676.1 hypothetical protein BXU11_01630 [Flavobacterium sp. LM5]
MGRLPIYIPDDEVNLTVGKLLFQLFILSDFTKKEFVFNLERITQFDFLTKHPILLNKILDEKHKKILSLNNSEIYSIEAMFPNKSQLFDFTKVKLVLNILISYGLLDIKIGEDSQIYYLINENGIKYADQLESIYFQRLKKLLSQMKPLLSMTHSKINQIIQSHL